MFESGMAITAIPAEFAAWVPVGASSNARQFFGGKPNLFAATKKMSGAGLPSETSGSSPVTIV